MDELYVTVVGTELIKSVEKILEALEMKYDDFRKGSIGNMKTMVYTFVTEQNHVIITRKKLMERIMMEPFKYTAMYVHGDWMRVFNFKKID